MALEGESPRYSARDRQRIRALTVANAQRSRKANLKRLIKRKEIDAAGLLSGEYPEWDEALQVMRLEELLRAMPRVGPLTMEEVAEELECSLHIRIRAMVDGQREQLALILRIMRGDNL